MKNGVPFDVAMSMDAVMRKAFSIKFGELDGGKFNFDSMAWENPQ